METNKYLNSLLEQNPFSFDYDSEMMKKILNEKDISQLETDTIEFFNDCSLLFQNSYNQIIEIYESFDSKENILDFLYKNLNKQHIIAYKSIIENSIPDESFALNLERLQFTKFKNSNGININAKNVLERGGDILNILIKYLESFNNYNVSEKKITPEKLEENFFKLWFYASNIYSFNSFYEIINQEEGNIINRDGNLKINFTKEFKTIETLITVSEIRNRNHVNEYSTYIGLFKKALGEKALDRKKITHYSIENGCINNLKVASTKNSEDDNIDFGKYLKINKYLENLDFQAFGNISLIQIVGIINAIEELIRLITENNLSAKTFEIGYKINKDILFEGLEKITNLQGDVISKVLSSITEKDESPYFWRKPLYEFDNYFYLSYSLLNAFNFDLLLESIIEASQISISEQIELFKNQIIDDLLNVSEKYTFRLVEVSDSYFKNNLIYELKDFNLIIELVILEKFPIEPKEINESLLLLGKAANIVSDKISKLSEKSKEEKNYIPLLLTNYTILSGLILNNIPIFDKTLLTNYFVTGNFRRAQVFLKSKKKPVIFNQFDYYGDEDEFNAHFPNFIFNPVPIVEIRHKLFWNESPVLPEGVNKQLYIDVCDYVDDNINIENKITSLNLSLNHQYYNKIDDKEKELYNLSIQFQLTDIFYLLAFGKYNLSFYRFDLSEIFQKLNVTGFAHLIFYFRTELNKLNFGKPKQDKKFKSVNYDEKSMNDLIGRIIDQNKIIRLSQFKTGIDLTKIEEKKLISFALDFISVITIKKYDEKDIEFQLLFLAIIKTFNKKYGLYNEFYSACSNIISALNFNNNYQTARNLAEEILVISIEENIIYKGWEILFICFEQQKNIFDALTYGCLYITSLSSEQQLSYNESVNVFFNILKFSRNIHSKDILDGLFNLLKTYKLKEYDEQKIHLSYFLSVFLNLPRENTKEKLETSLNYFNQNQKKIVKYKEKGIVPWLNYFYNIKRLQDEGFFDSTVSITESIEFLESQISEEYYIDLKQKHFFGKELKRNFIESLKNSLNTNSYYDYIFENQNLDLDANNLINDGIFNEDVESILLSGFITNDIKLIYNTKIIEPETIVPLTTDKSEYAHLDNYKEFIYNKIVLRKNQVIIYLFTAKDLVYMLLIDSSKNTKIIESGWTVKKMNKWLRNTQEFYFDSNKYYDLTEQEESYSKLLQQLEFTNFNIEIDADELLICTNLDLSNYPLHLIINNEDFLGTKKHISNILHLEWYLSNCQDILIERNYTSTCWAPIEDGDPDINYGFDKLKPILDKNNIQQYTSSFPDKIDSDINIFFAHGELNGSGFKAIYKSDKNDSAIISNKKLFGSGKIAILFVCHSGKMDKNLFSNSVISLVHEIIELGYSAVIAPCWSLEVTIPEFWLDNFLIKFNSGVYISEAVFYANNELAVYKESISNAYYVPEGRLAMHLYGNPNIRISGS